MQKYDYFSELPKKRTEIVNALNINTTEPVLETHNL